MDDRRKEPSAADIKAEKEARYEHSLAHAIEKARARRARMKANNEQTESQKLNAVLANIKYLTDKLEKIVYSK